MLIHVTQEHINDGNKCSSILCPIALAITKAMENRWSVGSTTAGPLNNRMDDEVTLPGIVTAFIRLFDKGEPVVPFSFELDV